MKKIKIGQIGTGHLHAYKIKALRRFPDIFELVGIAEDDPERRARAQRGSIYRDLNWMSSEELLALPDLDAVFVEVEEHDTLEVALRCIRAGKHIQMDKPAGESLPAFEALLAEAEAKQLTVQMGYMYRNSPAIEFCFNAVRSGLLGNISTIDAVMSRYDGQEFRDLMKTFKGGAAYIFLCHLVDMAVIMMGEPEQIIPLSTCTRGDGVVDNGFAAMTFSNGCTASLRTTIVEVGGFDRRNLVVCGDKGTVVVQPIEIEGDRAGGKVFLNLLEDSGGYKKGLQEIPQPPHTCRYEGQTLEFAAILRGEMENPYSYQHELLVQKCHLQACGYDVEEGASLQCVTSDVQLAQPAPYGIKRYRSANATVPAPKAGESRVVFFGDSITDFWNLEYSFPGENLINRGIRGQNTQQMCDRFDQDVLALQPDVVWFLGGTNDIAQGTSTERILDNVRLIVSRCRQAGIQVVLSSLLPVSDYHKDQDPLWERRKLRPQDRIREVNTGLSETAASEAAIYLDLFSLLIDSNDQMPADLADDGLHPNAKGYECITPPVRQALEQAKARCSN
jgi:predicted dehydrogenase/lysophospholipase L1-like esterase